jgi:hypothetical protein
MKLKCRRSIATFGVALAFGLVGVSTAAGAAGMPSGQRMIGGASFSAATGTFTGGGATIEPAYDDANGSLVYLLTPTNAKVNPPKPIDPSTGMPVNTAPLYLPVYPTGSGIDPATLNCAHLPADNCPDHGPEIAGAAMGIMPGVYSGGVVGHDHLVGIAKSGGDFNVLWEPVVVLFTNANAAKQHLTTLDEINAAVANHDAIEVPLPQADFKCASVSAKVYAHATPAPSV